MVLPVYAKQVFGAVTRRLSRRMMFVVSFSLLSVLFWTPPLPLATAALLFGGLAAGQLNPLIMAIARERIPSDLRGRIFGILAALALVAAPLGMLWAGLSLECSLVTPGQFFNPALREMDRVPESALDVL